MSKFLNISTDTNLGGNNPSDETLSSQKALKTYIDNNAGGANPDNVTISNNALDLLQAIGVIDNNGNPIKLWIGTKAQYDAISTKDANTLYYITDDATFTGLQWGEIGGNILNQTDLQTALNSKQSTLSSYLSVNSSWINLFPKVHFSTSEPTSGDGNNGDLWIVYEA